MARSIYRLLPAAVRRRASAVFHGETATQRRMSRLIREARGAFGVRGYGEALTGPPLHPYRAETTDHFDAHSHLADLQARVLAAVTEAQVPIVALPGQRPPLLVVSESDWGRAWQAMTTHERTAHLWWTSTSGNGRTLELSKTPDVADVRIYRHLLAPSGEHVAGQEIHIGLQRWSEVVTEDVPRPDGGMYSPGTLLATTGLRGNSYAVELSPATQRALRSPVSSMPTVEAVVEPIDFVYTWVDGSDPAWRTKRDAYRDGSGTTDAQIKSRFESHDELRYSLRSVEMFANWYNHLYLVTDSQIPSWLNSEHPRVTIVDHRDIFTIDELPVFNSHAIESRLHRIPNLSERFIYLNDDVFFGGIVYPENFYTGAGQVKFFPSKATIDPGPVRPEDVSVTSAAKNNRALLERSIGRTITTKLKHTPHAQLTSVLSELESLFPEVFKANVAARFRSPGDHSVVSGLSQRYAAATGRALEGRISYNYADLTRADLERLLAKFLRERRFKTFCLNDTGVRLPVVNKDQLIAEFLNSYFPLPSDFEISR